MSTHSNSSWPSADAAELRGMSDIAALERYAASADPRAFEVLAVRYRDMVLGTCLRVLSSMADAEDATQETFLKLARHAREIRSNAAAWLHATAVRTSLNALRRRASHARAVERSAAEARVHGRADGAGEQLESAEGGNEPTWREMRPIIDAALASLSDADRSLIVERFLAGRQQMDMAAEAGVSQGTMSRRIDGALERLRTELTRHGLAVTLACAAGALAVAPASVQASAGLSASVAKIGLSQLATVPAGAGAAAGAGAGGTVLGMPKLVVGLVAAALVAGGAGVGALLMNGHGGGGGGGGEGGPRLMAMGGAADKPGDAPGTGFDRPAKHDGTKLRLVNDTIAGFNGEILQFNGKKMIQMPGGEKYRDSLRLEFDIERCDAPGPKARLEMVVSKVVVGEGSITSMKVGDRLNGFWSVENQLMTMDISTEDSPNGMAGRFIAVRPYKGHPSRTDQKFSSEGNHELLAGTWIGMQELGLKIDKESIAMGQGDWNREGYRIISWERQDGFARVEVICKEAADRGLIGKRFKMLIRRTSQGDVTLTHYTLPSGKNGEWPKGFDEAFLKADPAGSVTPIQGLRTMIFRVERAR